MEKRKLQLEDLIICESCEGRFTDDKILPDGDNYLCKNCHDEISKEVRQKGVDNLDEFLKNRKLEKDFKIFSGAKWSGITEQEYKEFQEQF